METYHTWHMEAMAIVHKSLPPQLTSRDRHLPPGQLPTPQKQPPRTPVLGEGQLWCNYPGRKQMSSTGADDGQTIQSL